MGLVSEGVYLPLNPSPESRDCDRTRDRTGKGSNLTPSYLRELDTSFQERAVSSVVGADVAVLAPVAGEGAIHTGQAAAEGEKWAVLGSIKAESTGTFLGMLQQDSICR